MDFWPPWLVWENSRLFRTAVVVAISFAPGWRTTFSSSRRGLAIQILPTTDLVYGSVGSRAVDVVLIAQSARARPTTRNCFLPQSVGQRRSVAAILARHSSVFLDLVATYPRPTDPGNGHGRSCCPAVLCTARCSGRASPTNEGRDRGRRSEYQLPARSFPAFETRSWSPRAVLRSRSLHERAVIEGQFTLQLIYCHLTDFTVFIAVRLRPVP